MEEIEVPSYFLCPISLEIMRDPVTVSSGITYDRPSIEKWLFAGRNATCPLTKQALMHNGDPLHVIITPNHTLRRLIQGWCALHASHGVERFPTPKPPVTPQQVAKLLKDAARSSEGLRRSLRTLRTLAGESDANKRCLEASGVVAFLASVVVGRAADAFVDFESTDYCHVDRYELDAVSEAVGVLYHLNISDACLNGLFRKTNGRDCFVNSLVKLLNRGSCETRVQTVLLLKSMLRHADPADLLLGMPLEFFVEIVRVLGDQISPTTTKAALQLLVHLCPWGRNRVKAAQAGAVHALIEVLLEHLSSQRRTCEVALMALDQACECAEGRAEFVGHGAGLAVVSNKLLGVSAVASESAVRVLRSTTKFGGAARVAREMVEVGVVTKLMMVLQVGEGVGAKEKAAEILKLGGWNQCRPEQYYCPWMQRHLSLPLSLSRSENGKTA